MYEDSRDYNRTRLRKCKDLVTIPEAYRRLVRLHTERIVT